MLWEVDSTAIFGRTTHICRKSGRYGRKPRIYSRNWYTAKSGGGSFKKRKPTGEIRCCEPGVVKRIQWWTERCWRSFFFPPYFSFSDYQTTYLSIFYVSIYLCINLSLSFFHLLTCLSVCLSIYLSFYLALSFYLYHYLCLSVSFFLSSVYLSSCPAVGISICLFIYFSVYLWRSLIQRYFVLFTSVCCSVGECKGM